MSLRSSLHRRDTVRPFAIGAAIARLSQWSAVRLPVRFIRNQTPAFAVAAIVRKGTHFDIAVVPIFMPVLLFDITL